MGILGAIVKGVAKVATNRANRVVSSDLSNAELLFKKQYLSHLDLTSTQYHAKKLSDLSSDSGVSKEWLSDIIRESKTKVELDKVSEYLKHIEKTSNLSPESKRHLFKITNEKLKAISESEMMHKISEFIDNFGGDLL